MVTKPVLHGPRTITLENGVIETEKMVINLKDIKCLSTTQSGGVNLFINSDTSVFLNTKGQNTKIVMKYAAAFYRCMNIGDKYKDSCMSMLPAHHLSED